MSNTNTTACPKCGKENPAGAKFCSGCATALTASTGGTGPVGPTPGPQPVPPPPVPPSRPGLGGMLGRTGGKVDQRQISGDPAVLYAAAEEYIRGTEGSVIKAQYPHQQITAAIVFKSFMATLNAPVRADCEISIAPAGGGVNTVTVGGKVDYGSATSLWVTNAICFIVGLFILPFLIWLILLALSIPLTIFSMNSHGPKRIADELFERMSQAGAAGVAPAAQPAPVQEQAVEPPAPEPEPVAPVANGASGGDQDLSERMRKLNTLKEQGLISEEEYDTRRASILAEI